MADPSDLLKGWRDLAGQITGLASSVAEQAGKGGGDLVNALTKQAEVVEQVLRRQLELEQELVKKAFAPAVAIADVMDEAPNAMRAQAKAFRAAAASFTQAAQLLETQAAALEQSLRILKAPGKLAQTALGTGRRAAPDAGD